MKDLDRAFLLSVAVFGFGCGGNKVSKNTVAPGLKIKAPRGPLLFRCGSMPNSTEPVKDIRRCLADFESRIRIKVQITSVGTGDLPWTKITTAATSGDTPDPGPAWQYLGGGNIGNGSPCGP